MITETVDAESDSEEHLSVIHVSPSKITIDCHHTVVKVVEIAIFGYRRSSCPFGRAESVAESRVSIPIIPKLREPVGQWAWQQFSFLSYKTRFSLKHSSSSTLSINNVLHCDDNCSCWPCERPVSS